MKFISFFSFKSTNSEPLMNKEIPNINVHQPLSSFDESSYFGDEYYDSSLYSSQHQMDSMLTPSPKRSKRLPNNVTSTTSQQKPTTPSIMTAAGAGLSSLFSSISHTLQSPVVTTSNYFMPTSDSITTSNSAFSMAHTPTTNYTFSSAYSPTTSSYKFSSAYTPVSTSSIFSSAYMPTTTSSIFSSAYTSTTTNSIFSSAYVPTSSSAIFSSAYTPTTTNAIFSSDYSMVTSSFDTIVTCYGNTDFDVAYTSSYSSVPSFSKDYVSTYSTTVLDDNYSTTVLDDNYSTTVLDDNYSTTVLDDNYSTTSLIPTTTATINPPVTSYDVTSSYSLSAGYNSIFDNTYSTSFASSSVYVKETPPVTVSAPSSSLFGALSSLFDIGVSTTTPVTTTTVSTLYSTTSMYTPASTSYNLNSNGFDSTTPNYSMTSSYPTMSLGILGHSPILEEEDLENETMYEETYPETSTAIDPYVVDEYKIIVDATTSSYMTSNILSSISNNYLSSISDPYYATSSIYDTVMEEKLEEEYREDYEEGVQPLPVTAGDLDYNYTLITTSSASTEISVPPTTTAAEDYYYENSTYPMTSKLSTIPETSNDIYLSNNDLQEEETEIYDEQLTTPGAYDYTENENDYIASGDLKNTNLYQSNYTSQTTASSTLTSTATTSSSNLLTQPEQKKSRFGLGSLFSDGLNVIGSGVNSIKSTATNLAGGAAGVVGGVVGAAAAAAQSTQNMGQNMSQNQNNIQSQNTTSGPSMTTNQQSFTSQPSMKLTKQVSEMYDEQQEDYMDPYGAKQQQQVENYFSSLIFSNIFPFLNH
jgi:hypothetical protein